MFILVINADPIVKDELVWPGGHWVLSIMMVFMISIVYSCYKLMKLIVCITITSISEFYLHSFLMLISCSKPFPLTIPPILELDKFFNIIY